MLKVPEGWSLRLFGLHRDVTVPMILEDPSGTGGNGGGNGSNGGNGGNGGNGADHAVVTPTSIQAEIAHALTEVDGSPPGHQKHPGKRLDGGSGPSKPR
jgi:hypothetical protein